MPIISSEPPLLVGIDRIATLAAQWHSHPAGLPKRYVCEIIADNAIDKSDTALERRQRERMAVRVLLHTLLPDYEGCINYEISGRPILSNGYHISISHSNQWAAVALHPHQAVGIDIEELRPKIVRIAERFLSASETNYLSSIIRSDRDRLMRYTVYWAAKEALYKWYAQGELSFRDHLQIRNYNSGTGVIEATLQKGDLSLVFAMHCERIDDAVMCVWTENSHPLSNDEIVSLVLPPTQ